MVTFAIATEPCIIFLIQPGTDIAQLAGKSIALQLEIFQDPSLGLYASHRQLDKMKGSQRFFIRYIVFIRTRRFGSLDIGDLNCVFLSVGLREKYKRGYDQCNAAVHYYGFDKSM